MKLVSFLGNIGENYKNTRHNVGFMFGDYLIPDADFKEIKSRDCLEYQTGNYIFIKPATFMNGSGFAVLKAIRYYKIGVGDLMVVHDDVDISLGDYRYTKSSGHAGHRGVANVIDLLGTQDFERIRIGIGHSPDPNISTDVWVLQNFSKEELSTLTPVFQKLKSLYFSGL